VFKRVLSAERTGTFAATQRELIAPWWHTVLVVVPIAIGSIASWLVIRERIVNALASGDSQAAIARALRVSRNTISAVAEQEWSKVEQRKARIAAQSERNATRAAELIAEKLEHQDVPLNVLVPVYGVSVDKALALRGDPQLRIAFDHSHQHIHAHIQESSFQDLLAKLPRRNHAPEDTPADDSTGA
jgi:hypothetical protein